MTRNLVLLKSYQSVQHPIDIYSQPMQNTITMTTETNSDLLDSGEYDSVLPEGILPPEEDETSDEEFQALIDESIAVIHQSDTPNSERFDLAS